MHILALRLFYFFFSLLLCSLEELGPSDILENITLVLFIDEIIFIRSDKQKVASKWRFWKDICVPEGG